MFKLIEKLDFSPNNINKYKFILLSFLLLLLVVTPFAIIKSVFHITASNTTMDNKTILESFIIGVILGPVLETLIFQIGIIKISLFIKKNEKLAIFVSALAFGLTHLYSVYYFAYTFSIGLYFAYLYFFSIKKQLKPFWPLSIVHSLFNLMIFCFKFFCEILVSIV